MTDDVAGTRGQIVHLIHGIRTYAGWQERVISILESVNGTKVFATRYGKFDLMSFLLPGPTRRPPIRKTLTDLIHTLKLAEKAGSSLTIIAHSYGTHAIHEILSQHPSIEIDNLILCGAIKGSECNWLGIKKANVRGTLINDYGTKDVWPVAAASFTWGYGKGGTYGIGQPFIDRRHPLKHSDFFDDNFVKKFWLPFFQTGQIVPADYEANPNHPWWFSVIDKPWRWGIASFFGIVSAWIAIILYGQRLGDPPTPINSINKPETETSEELPRHLKDRVEHSTLRSGNPSQPNSVTDETVSASQSANERPLESVERVTTRDFRTRFELVETAPIYDGLGAEYRFKILDSSNKISLLKCDIKLLDENLKPYISTAANSCDDISVIMGYNPLPNLMKYNARYKYAIYTGIRIYIKDMEGNYYNIDEDVYFNDEKPPEKFKDEKDKISDESNNGIFGPKETMFGRVGKFSVWAPPGYVCDWSDTSPFFHSQIETGSCTTSVSFMQDNPKIPRGINRNSVAGVYSGTLNVTIRSDKHGVWRKTWRTISTKIDEKTMSRWLFWYNKAPYKTTTDRIRASLSSTESRSRSCIFPDSSIIVTGDNDISKCECAKFKKNIRGYEEFDWEFMRPKDCQ